MTFLEEKSKGEGLQQPGRVCREVLASLKEEKIIDVLCSVCGKPGKMTEFEASNRTTICRVCADKRNWAAQEERDRPRNIERLGGDKAYNNFKLSNFTNKIAVDLCAGYPEKNLYLWGAAGTGKTHLATALVRQYPEARVVKPQHIYRECRGLKDGAEEQAAVNYFRDLPYLVIDDIGQDKRTEWAFSTFYEIIDARWMWEKKGLIITSNFSLGDLAQRMNSDCIVSRINGLCETVEIAGKDGRMNL